MSIYQRKPNGYYITRYKYHLLDSIGTKKKPPEWKDAGSPDEKEWDTCILSYNGIHEIVVNRQRLVDASGYFRGLLAGNFIESNQSKVNIVMDEDNFSFEIFKAVIDYANEGRFDGTRSDLGYYIDMVQLATFWLYDGLVELLENHLCLNVNTRYIISLANVAELLNLKRLKESCAQYSRWLDRPAENYSGPMITCPRDGHEGHHYMNCMAGQDPEDPNEAWGDELSNTHVLE